MALQLDVTEDHAVFRTLGQGTTFVMRLPLRADPGDEPHVDTSEVV